MTDVGNAGRVERLWKRNKELMKHGWCTFCRPHDGENRARSRRGPRKSKAKK